MKKAISGAFACFLLLMVVLFAVPTDVRASSVETMDIDVELQRDGSAVITQHWTNACADEGTEYYLYYKDSGYLTFSDLSVSDASRTYENIGAWDVDAGFDEKAWRCGIHEVDDGVELCWGISEYGTNDFTISYTIGNLVSAYKDTDGLFYRFVNSMDFFPTNASVTIHMADKTPLTDGNAAIWAFGYDGDIVFQEDGSIYAHTASPLSGDENMTILVRLDSSLIWSKHAFKHQTMEKVIDKALKNSDYYDTQDNPVVTLVYIVKLIFSGLFTVGLAGLIVWGIYSSWKERRAIRAFYAQCGYYAGIPCDGSLDAAYQLGQITRFCGSGSLMSSYLMKLMISGAVEVIPDKENTSVKDLLLHPEAAAGGTREAELMMLLAEASEGDNRITPDELKKYAKNQYRKFSDFIGGAEKAGTDWLREHGCLTGTRCKSMDDLNDAGRAQLAQLLGVRRYLEALSKGQTEPSVDGFTEKGAPEDLVVYAVLFNLLEQYEVYYRDRRSDDEYYEDPLDAFFLFGHEAHDFGGAIIGAAASGGGGSASSGGGGGFSGGGGGGTR